MERQVASAGLIEDYFRLFVNRRAYTVQSGRPHSKTGKQHYYRPKDAIDGKTLVLTYWTVSRHLEGKSTIGLYAINPQSQRCKWVAIDAEYENSLEHLLKLQWESKNDNVKDSSSSGAGKQSWLLPYR